MDANPSPRLERIFARIVRARWLWVACYAVLLVPGAFFALRVAQDNSLDRLIVPSDPDFIATRAFEEVFGSSEFALLLAETDDPFAPEVLARVDAIERALQKVPNVAANSALSIFRRTRSTFEATPETAEAFRRFVDGTDLLRRQGLVGKDFVAIALSLAVKGPVERNQALAGIDAAIAAANPAPSPLRKVTPLGLPFVNAYLDATQSNITGYFALFTAFVVVLNLLLYRSWRTLLAFLVTLGVCLALSVGYRLDRRDVHAGDADGADDDLVTATATLVYLPLALRRTSAGSPGRSISLRTLEQVPRLHGVDLRHRRGLRGADDLSDPARSARWATGWRWGSASRGSSSSRCSRRCNASCARPRARASRWTVASNASPAGSRCGAIASRWPLVVAAPLSAAGGVALFGLPG